jgi:hypothetical protein
MSLTKYLYFTSLTVAVLLVAWQFQHHFLQDQELAGLEMQSRSMAKKLESQNLDLAELEKENLELEAAERRAGNQNLISLMKERNAASMAAKQEGSKKQMLGHATARVMDNPEQKKIEQEMLRNQCRAGLSHFFRLGHVSPENQEQYIDLQIEMQQHKAARTSALLQGKMSVADAVQERDNDLAETERRRRQILGEDATKWFDGIADGMRTDEAKRLIKEIRQNMGANPLSEEQVTKLQDAIKIQVTNARFDEVDAFRSPEEVAQMIRNYQNVVWEKGAEFLSPAQLEAVKGLGGVYVDQQVQIMMQRRKALGIR